MKVFLKGQIVWVKIDNEYEGPAKIIHCPKRSDDGENWEIKTTRPMTASVSNSFIETNFVYVPYIPLQMSKGVNLNSFTKNTSIRYANKVVNSSYYGITSGVVKSKIPLYFVETPFQVHFSKFHLVDVNNIEEIEG
jgi:hypothetical protein